MPASRPSRRGAAKARSRARILAAATRLIAEHGLESLSFAEIAAAARISRPLIYFHFKDRDELFHEAVARANQMLYERFVEAVAAHQTGLEQIVALGRAYQAFFEEHPREFALISCYGTKTVNAARPSEVKARIISCDQAIMKLMRLLIVMEVLVCALCLWAFTHGLLQVTATQGASIEEFHGVKPRALVDFGFELLKSVLEPR